MAEAVVASAVRELKLCSEMLAHFVQLDFWEGTFVRGPSSKASRFSRKNSWLAHVPFLGVAALFAFAPRAEAVCAGYPNTLTNGTTANANQVMANFNYVFDCPLFMNNVGIGTTSPLNTLEVRSPNATGQALLYKQSGGGDSYVRLNFGNSLSSNYWQIATSPDSTASSSIFNFYTPSFGNVVTLLGNGNVGIGTTSPINTLEVRSPNATGQALLFKQSGGGDSYVRLNFGNSVSSNYWQIATSPDSAASSSIFNLYTPSFGDVVTLLGNGNVGIGNTAPAYKLDVAGDVRFGGGGPGTIRLYESTVYDTGAYLHLGAANVYSDGDFWTPGGIVWDSSDLRLKKDIRALEGALDKIMQIRPVQFSWRNASQHGGSERTSGFIAQDMRNVFPEMVTEVRCQGEDCNLAGSEKTVLGVGVGHVLSAYLVRSIQELKGANDELKEESAILHAALDRVEREVEALRRETSRGAQ